MGSNLRITDDAFAYLLPTEAKMKIIWQPLSTPTGGSPALQDNRYSSDLSAAKEHIGYEPKYQMQDAVRAMAEWLKSRTTR